MKLTADIKDSDIYPMTFIYSSNVFQFFHIRFIILQEIIEEVFRHICINFPQRIRTLVNMNFAENSKITKHRPKSIMRDILH